MEAYQNDRPKLCLFRLFNIIAVMRTVTDSAGLLDEDRLEGELSWDSDKETSEVSVIHWKGWYMV